MSEASQATPEIAGASTPKPASLPDLQRLKLAARNHGLALLAAMTLWAAADAWAMTSGLSLATGLSVLNAFAAKLHSGSELYARFLEALQ
mgnify:CR=1 FL=1